MIVCPGVIVAEKPYDPFVVFTMQLVAEVGMVGEVVMQASEIAAPLDSWTVPVMVVVCFALAEGSGVGEGEWNGSVGSGVAMTGVVGAGTVAGARVTVLAGVGVGLAKAAGASVGRTAGTADGVDEGAGVGEDVGATRSVPICGRLPFSWITADDAAARAFAAAPEFPRTS